MNRNEQRKADREKRRAERNQRREARLLKQKMQGPTPPVIQFPPSTDELKCYDRNKTPIGHCLRDLWRPNPAFLVCGGPSLKTLDLSKLKERGIMSLGVNNVAAFAPCRAFTCSDPPEKFCNHIWLDPAVMKLIPAPKLNKRVRAKLPDGTFRMTAFRTMDCPNTWGYLRCTTFDPATFLTAEAASWGVSAADAEATGRNKIYFTFFLGLRLLHYLGCPRVYLIGVDFTMSSEPGGGYCFSQNRWPGAVRGNNAHYRTAIAMCEELKPVFDAAGFEVYNCNPNSALRVWPHVPFEQAVEDCRGLVGKEPFSLDKWYEKPNMANQEEQEDDRGT